MDLHVWLAYFVAAWVIALSPGSGAVLSMSHGLAYGVRQTTATIVGLQIGLAFILLVAGAGVGALLLTSAVAFTVVKVLGAGYLLWLGWRQWRAPVAGQAGHAEAVRAVPLSARQRLVQGALTNATNPKGIVFMLAVLPQFIDPARPQAIQYVICGATLISTDLIVMTGYTAFAAKALRLLKKPSQMKVMNRAFGGLLMGMSALLATFKRAG